MKWTEEQLDAINKDNTSIIVSAGAGSGKTAVLTERVIRKIKDGVNINELLILTFTNKAANEMRERIRAKIKTYPELKEQLDLINEAYITTFDSFALSTLKKYHYVLNLPKNIKISDSSLIFLIKKESIDIIFEELYKEENQYFFKLINDFCIKDDNEIKNYILDIYDCINLLIDKNEYLDHYIDNFFNQKNINNNIKKFENLINMKLEKLNNYLDNVSSINSEYYAKLYDCLNKLIESNNYNEIIKNLNFRIPNLPKNADEELKYTKEKISEIIKDIKNICEYDSIEDINNSIILTSDYIKIVIEIIKKLDNKLLKYKKENNIYEFNDISIMLINILKNNPNICLEIKKQYKEIMVDEYQDTSDIQEQLISLIQNNNVYMVGDIKQSIYRFRNANPYIFQTKYEKYKKGQDGIKIDLNQNFRSRYEVLNNVNLLFSKLMSSQIGGADYTNGHEMIYGNKNYDLMSANKNYNMDILNYNYDKELGFTKEEIEIFIIANDILNKVKNKYQIVDKKTFQLRDCTFKDFAILIDRSTNFDLFKKIFEFMKIPLTIYKDEHLNNGPEIIVIKNIIKLILKIHQGTIDTEFKYLFTSIARSFLFEYSDNDIFEFFSNNNFYDNKIYLKCHQLSKYINTYTNTMLIDKIITEFNLMQKIITLGDIQNRIIRIDYLSELACNLDNLGYTITDFSDYLNKLSNSGYYIKFSLSKDNPNSVQIMTIHNSKGLEFNVCYFPLLYKEFNLRDLNEKFLFDNEYGIITPYFKEGIGKTIFKHLLKNKYIEEEIAEKIRLFYVALTRAKEKLILITNLDNQNYDTFEDDKLQFRSFSDMLNFLGVLINPYKKDINLSTINLSHSYNLNNKTNNLNNFSINQPKFVIKELQIDNFLAENKNFSKIHTNFISKKEEKNLQIGTYFHYLLENIDFKTKNIDNYNINQFYKQKIINFLNQDIFKNLQNAKIYKEYEFIEIDKNIKTHGVIDLMIEYDNYIDIVDYKFKKIDDENYNNQLLGYKNFIEKKANKTVNIYLYSIITNKLKNIK